MRRLLWKFLVPLVVCAFASAVNAEIKVDESATQIFVKGKTLRVELVTENSTKTTQASVQIEILNEHDSSIARAEETREIKSGRTTLQFSLQPIRELGNDSDIVWYRLRYSISLENSLLAKSTLSLSQLMPQLFELGAVASDNVFSGMNFRVRVRAFHPVSNLPAQRVKLSGLLDVETKGDADNIELKSTGRTNKEGFALLEFRIPKNAKLSYNSDLEIRGERAGIIREIDEELNNFQSQEWIYLNSDKPLYQPGQQFFMRGLLINRRNLSDRSVSADRELEFSIEDEDDTLLYKETVKTSRFGVASIGWKIPENAKLGTYRIKVEDDDGEEIGFHQFKVTRYDLPQFTVTAKAEKSFYLPNENTAEITVSADYLFGKPVANARVRVVHESDRSWNYREQKWDIEEKASYDGTLNSDGKFTNKVDLSDAQKELAERSYRRFADVTFVAYVTDLTTNRAEQRRFDVRVSREAIHVYLIGETYNRDAQLPIEYYVSTFYADGSPAKCDVQIKGKYEDEESSPAKTLTTTKTNSFGAGKFSMSAPAREDDDYRSNLDLEIIAQDEKSLSGKIEEEIDFDEDAESLLIRTKKTILKKGEPIELEIISRNPEAEVWIDVAKDWNVVRSKKIRLTNGRGETSIPYDENFSGGMQIGAFIYSDDEKAVSSSRGVVYPSPQNLKIDVEFSKAQYRPAEEARARFRVANASNSNFESALGVVVFDKAIEERAHTDAEFGGNWYLFSRFADLLGYEVGFGNLTYNDINELDLSKPLSEELQLAAEVMYANTYFRSRFFRSNDRETTATAYRSYFEGQFSPVNRLLDSQYNKDFTQPHDENSLKDILRNSGIDFANLRDPWGSQYKIKFFVTRSLRQLQIISAGADKKFDTADDATVYSKAFEYFKALGSKLKNVVESYHIRTGGYIRDDETLRDEFAFHGINLDSIRDPWNQPYRITFEVAGREYRIRFSSTGENKNDDGGEEDDFDVWTNFIDYFIDSESKIGVILGNYTADSKTFPKDEKEFVSLLANNQIPLSDFHDGYGRAIYTTAETFSRYADRVKIESVAKFGEKQQEKISILPVTQQVARISLRSMGEDGIEGNADDFLLASFSGVISEQTKDDEKPRGNVQMVAITGSRGAIRGVITDANGAVIPGAKITATNKESAEQFFATTNSDGEYVVLNLSSGRYQLKAESPGFNPSVIDDVSVRSMNATDVNITLDAGATSVTVEVSAPAVELSTNMSASLVSTKTITFGTRIQEQISTPRLREYFPETLVWQPDLITDKNGNAELKFKLGDNLTTWKLAVIGSNIDGKIGLAEKEFQSFQPFFADLDPPKVLTEGDEIALPVPIRNYTDQTQNVSVVMSPGNWFSFLGTDKKQVEVTSNATTNAVFDFRATSAVKDGKQRVTAIAQSDSDAIEKSVSVFPNGEENVSTQSQIFHDAANFEVDFPQNALAKTQRAELKIYPNLLSHVVDSIEGILSRPYGCGEQTISSTYPNILVLKLALARKDSAANSKLTIQAKKYLQEGYLRLLSYQTSEGGFAYWTQQQADAALTAYALRFLSEAAEFIDIDESVIERALKYLVANQAADGSWRRIYAWEKFEDTNRTKSFTSYVARALASIERDKKEKSKIAQTALKNSLEYLNTRNAEIDDPYSLAGFALALIDSDDVENSRSVIEKLASLALNEGNGTYWNLETNTPFYGWGFTGRIESTALVVQALTRSKDQTPKIKELISRGTIFLLKNKDQYGVSYSTQATINVLDAFLASIGKSVSNDVTQKRTAQIFVNGEMLNEIAMPEADVIAPPIVFDLSSKLAPIKNRVEVKSATSNSALMAQVVSTHYISWQDATANGRDVNKSRQLRLEYSCDKTNVKPLDEITCRVETERIGFRGYGMLLAEIGLPPGADVDRSSLEKAREANWNFSRYEILPDRIVVYLWAQAGGTNFSFKFRPRFGINAQTARSIVYDYYNPEAKATFAPLKFLVR